MMKLCTGTNQYRSDDEEDPMDHSDTDQPPPNVPSAFEYEEMDVDSSPPRPNFSSTPRPNPSNSNSTSGPKPSTSGMGNQRRDRRKSSTSVSTTSTSSSSYHRDLHRSTPIEIDVQVAKMINFNGSILIVL